MSRSLDDILGPPEPAPDAPLPSDPNRLREEGVSLAWLQAITGHDRRTVKKRLADCPAITRKNGYERYDPIEALAYLIKPKFNIRKYLKTMSPNELPAMLRKEYWQAENQRMRYMELAGELWPTQSVLGVFAEAFKLIKDTSQVWVDDVEREAGLTQEQYASLSKRVDALREEMYRVLVELPKEGHHGHALEEGPLGDDDDSDAD